LRRRFVDHLSQYAAEQFSGGRSRELGEHQEAIRNLVPRKALLAVVEKIDVGSIGGITPHHGGHRAASPRFVRNTNHSRVEH
jgi:hypothetical protein